MRFSARLLPLSLLLGRIYADGFLPSTSVLTPSGTSLLQDLQVGSPILGFNEISGLCEPCEVSAIFIQHDWPVRDLLISGRWLRCAANQMFLCSDGFWRTAEALEEGTQPLKQGGDYETIYAVEDPGIRQNLMGLSVSPHRTLCLAEDGLVAHNLVFMIPLATWVLGEGIMWIGLAALGSTALMAGSQLAQQRINHGSQSFEWSYLCGAAGTMFRKPNRSSGSSSAYAGGGSCSSGAMPPDQRPPERETERGGPNGRFEHSPKHGTKAYGNVSAAPKNGQAALDVSVSAGNNSTGRFGYSEGQFVALKQTSDGVFHGYQIPWEKVPLQIQQLWRAEGVVTAGGRFCLSAGAAL